MIFLYVIYKKYKKIGIRNKEENYIVIEKEIFLLVLVGIAVWLTASGIGGFCNQSGDWHKHNAVLHDLVTYEWPVKYELSEGGQGLLSYYIFSYLFPALVGKIAGFRLAEITMLFQSIIGVLLVYLHLCYFLKVEKKYKRFLVFVLLVLFGGLVLLGKGKRKIASTFSKSSDVR